MDPLRAAFGVALVLYLVVRPPLRPATRFPYTGLSYLLPSPATWLRANRSCVPAHRTVFCVCTGRGSAPPDRVGRDGDGGLQPEQRSGEGDPAPAASEGAGAGRALLH